MFLQYVNYTRNPAFMQLFAALNRARLDTLEAAKIMGFSRTALSFWANGHVSEVPPLRIWKLVKHFEWNYDFFGVYRKFLFDEKFDDIDLGRISEETMTMACAFTRMKYAIKSDPENPAHGLYVKLGIKRSGQKQQGWYHISTREAAIGDLQNWGTPKKPKSERLKGGLRVPERLRPPSDPEKFAGWRGYRW